jgi:inner membrane protein
VPTVFTHAAVGLGLAAIAPFPRRPAAFYAVSAAVAVMPDADVVAFALGAPYGSVWAHRGVSHSLLAAVAIGAVTALPLARVMRVAWLPLAAFLALATASHGVLDAMTNGGPGIAFLAPFDDARHFLPWRPVEVSPLGRRFFSARGVRVLLSELQWVWLPAGLVVVLARLARPGRDRPRARLE